MRGWSICIEREKGGGLLRDMQFFVQNEDVENWLKNLTSSSIHIVASFTVEKRIYMLDSVLHI